MYSSIIASQTCKWNETEIHVLMIAKFSLNYTMKKASLQPSFIGGFQVQIKIMRNICNIFRSDLSKYIEAYVQ